MPTLSCVSSWVAMRRSLALMKGVQLRADTRANIVREIIQKQRTLESAAGEWGVDIQTVTGWIEEYLSDARFALESRAREVLQAAGVATLPATDLEFAGSLDQMSLADVLQWIILHRRSCITKLTAPGGSGRIWLRDGEVCDAEFEEQVGERAFFSMLGIKFGTFRVEFQAEDRIRSIHRGTQALILEAAKRTDEAHELEGRIGGGAQVFTRSDRALADSVQLRPQDMKTLMLFDAQRNLDEVLRASPLDEFATLSQVARLLDEGYLLPSSIKPVVTSVPTHSLRAFDRASLILGRAPEVTVPRRTGARTPLLVALAATLGLAGVTAFHELRPAQPSSNVHFTTLPRPAKHVAAAPIIEAQPQPGAAPIVTAPKSHCAEGLTWVPGGDLLMGTHSAHPALRYARPPQQRSVTGFCLVPHEVTVAEYQACVQNGTCSPAHDVAYWPQGPTPRKTWTTSRKVRSEQCNVGRAERADHPINCVSYGQAEQFCSAAKQRLPSESEWEMAARGAQARRYPWGNSPPSALTVNACGKECEIWHRGVGLLAEFVGTAYNADDGYASTAPVGALKLGATPEGVFDLAGNVSEWTTDSAYEYGKPVAAHTKASAVHIIRGGAFNSGLPEILDASFRFAQLNETFSPSVGFRCASDAIP